MNKKIFKHIISRSSSKSDVCRSLKLPINGTGFDIVNALLMKHNVSIAHFDRGAKKVGRMST